MANSMIYGMSLNHSVDWLWRIHKPFGELKKPILLTIILCLISSFNAAHAQGVGASSNGTNVLSSGLNLLAGLVEQDVPGATNPYAPLLFPPYFCAEVRVTPVYMDLIKGEILFNGKTINLETPESGVGLSSKGAYVELMARLQLSRFSFRSHYYADIRRIPGGTGYVNWPNWRFGADVDLVNTYGVRLGPTLDFNPERPSLSFNIPPAQIPGNSGKVDGYAPLTVGLFISYNPYYSWVVTPTFEFRYRWPFPFRSGGDLRGQMTQVTEWEYALGLKLPRTRATGTVGLRFGSRDTTMEFAGSHETGTGPPVMLHWNGKFIELVWFY